MRTNQLNKTNQYFYIVFVLFIAVFLRLYKLGQQSFWYDEVCSITFSCRPFTIDLFKDHYLLRPVYFVFLNLWTSFLGVNEIITRLPSVIFGVSAILVIYKLAKQLFGKNAGFIAAFLLAISYFHVACSQQARNYALLLLLCLLSNLYYFKILETSRSTYYKFYTIITILAILTSPVAIFVPIVQNIHFYIFSKGLFNKKTWATATSVIVIVVFILFAATFLLNDTIKEDMAAAAILKPNIQSIGKILGVFNYGGGKIAQGATANVADSGVQLYHCLLTIALSVLYLTGIVNTAFKEKGALRKIWFLILWQWIPILLSLFPFIFGINFLSAKYLIFTLPAYYLVVSRGIVSFKSKTSVILLLLIIALLNIPSFMKYYYPDDCFSWREVSSYIKSKIRNNDTIVLSPLQGIAPFWLYYKKDFKNLYLFGNGIGGKGIKVNGEWQSSFLDGDILVYGINMGDVKLFVEKIVSERILMNRTGDFWFIVQDGWIGEKEYRILNDFFNSHFSLIEAKHYPFEGIQLFRFMAKKEVLYE